MDSEKQNINVDISDDSESVLYDVLADHFGDAKDRVFGTAGQSAEVRAYSRKLKQKKEQRERARSLATVTPRKAARRFAAKPAWGPKNNLGARKRKSAPPRRLPPPDRTTDLFNRASAETAKTRKRSAVQRFKPT